MAIPWREGHFQRRGRLPPDLVPRRRRRQVGEGLKRPDQEREMPLMNGSVARAAMRKRVGRDASHHSALEQAGRNVMTETRESSSRRARVAVPSGGGGVDGTAALDIITVV